jgi:excisionase family DNA binding protein
MEEELREIKETLRVLLEATNRPQQEWLSIKQAAVVGGVSPEHIRRAVLRRTLPSSNVGSVARPTYRISRKDLTEWFEKQKAGPLMGRRKQAVRPYNPFYPELAGTPVDAR